MPKLSAPRRAALISILLAAAITVGCAPVTSPTQQTSEPDVETAESITDETATAPATEEVPTEALTPTRGATSTPDQSVAGRDDLPDGMIAYVVKGGNSDIYVMNANGSNPTRLTTAGGSDEYPQWSRDGQRISFTSRREGFSRVYAINVDGTNEGPLFPDDNVETSFQAHWSPDGTKVVFVSHRDGDMEIYSANVNGTNITRLTNSPNFDWMPKWSPDGSKIVFASGRDGNWEIYSMNADGSNPTRLTDMTGYDNDPVWSPDSSQIAFLTTREGGRAVYIMNADGSDPHRLIAETADHMQPAWSPDGMWIMFTQGVGTQAELMLLRIGEEVPFNLSNSPRDEVQASWQPQAR